MKGIVEQIGHVRSGKRELEGRDQNAYPMQYPEREEQHCEKGSEQGLRSVPESSGAYDTERLARALQRSSLFPPAPMRRPRQGSREASSLGPQQPEAKIWSGTSCFPLQHRFEPHGSHLTRTHSGGFTPQTVRPTGRRLLGSLQLWRLHFVSQLLCSKPPNCRLAHTSCLPAPARVAGNLARGDRVRCLDRRAGKSGRRVRNDDRRT